MFEGGIVKSLGTWIFKKLALIEDENKVIREVIFNLLAVWHYSNFYSNFYKNLPAYKDKISTIMINATPANIIENSTEKEIAEGKQLLANMMDTLVPTLMPIVMAKIIPPLEDLEKQYATAVDKLATIYPVKAYRLKNQVKLVPLLEDMMNMVQSAGQQSGLLGQEDSYLKGIDTVANSMKLELLQQQISILEESMRTLIKLDGNTKNQNEMLELLNNKNGTNEDFENLIQPQIEESIKSFFANQMIGTPLNNE